MGDATRSEHDSEAHREARRGTPRERRRYVEERRAAAGDRDRRRRRLARRDAGTSSFAIERDRGFASLAPGALRGADEVVRDALALIDELGPNMPSSGKDHLTTGLLPRDSLSLDSSFISLALDDEVLTAVFAYLGMVPVLNTVDVWHSRPVDGEPQSSQLFHLDFADVTQVKLFVHCTDVGEGSGPLCVLDASRSRRVAKRSGYRIGDGRVGDERVAEILGDDAEPVALTGPPGSAHLVDTSRCFHFGSRVEPGSPPRTIAVTQYLTPYAFPFARDHREEAPFRNLAERAPSERDRLVLGAE